MVVEGNILADDVGAAAVFLFPEGVAEDGGTGTASLIVRGGEGAAEDGVQAEGFEELATT